jgi:hypothetical protein
MFDHGASTELRRMSNKNSPRAMSEPIVNAQKVTPYLNSTPDMSRSPGESLLRSQARAHRHAKRPGALLEVRVPAPVDRDGSSLFHVCHPSISELRLAEITSNAGHRLASLCTRKALEPPNLINPPKERT